MLFGIQSVPDSHALAAGGRYDAIWKQDSLKTRPKIEAYHPEYAVQEQDAPASLRDDLQSRSGVAHCSL